MQRSYDRPAGLDNPRSPRRAGGSSNFEMYSWLFMRFSGIVLVVLVLGHLFDHDDARRRGAPDQLGLRRRRWASPFWQIWDLLMLWLAELHGGNGLRTSSTTTPARTPPGSGCN